MRHPIVPVLALTVVALAACSRRAGPSERVASAPRPKPVSQVVDDRQRRRSTRARGPRTSTASSAEPVVKSELPPGGEVFKTTMYARCCKRSSMLAPDSSTARAQAGSTGSSATTE